MVSEIFSRKYSLLWITGFLLGISVVWDPYVTNFIRLSLFKIIPYQFTLVSAFILLFAAIAIIKFSHLMVKLDFLFFLLFSIAFQSTSLIKISIINGDEVVLIIFLVLTSLGILVHNYRLSSPSPIIVLNSLLFFSVIASFVNGIDPRLFLIFAKSLLIFFLLYHFLNRWENIALFTRIFISVTAISASLALIQEAVFLLFHISLVGFTGPEGVALESTPIGTFLRVPGFLFGGYKLFAIILMTSSMLVLNMILYGANRSLREDNGRRLLYLIFFLIVSALILTFSKDAILAFLLGLILSILIRWPRYLIQGFGLLLILIIVLYGTGLLDVSYRYMASEITHGEYRGRIELDREGIEGFLNSELRHKLTGRGLGKGKRYTAHHNDWPAHNAFILALDEIGLTGATVYILFFLYLIFRLFTTIPLTESPAEKALSRGLLISLMCLFILLQFHASFIEPFLWMIFALVDRTSASIISNSRLIVSA